ncbi:MAG TPA: amino acid deaminase [Pseudonocardia sp.]|nr:amino acid deaminase [Pseudonocardia sp.]
MSGSLTATTRLPDAAAERLDNWPKSLPPVAAGRSVGDFLAGRPRLSEFSTPLLVLDDSAMAHNTARMAGWCADRRVALAPHGKTTMAPALWRRQLDAGAWGITVATASQLWVAVAAGVRRVVLANALVDPVALTRLAGLLDADPQLQVLTWADSVDTVAAMEDALTEAAPGRPVTVLVELGAAGGRTGARDLATARAVADAVAAAAHVELGGVAGYEGALAHDASPAGLGAVRAFLSELAALHSALRDAGGYPGPAVVTAGGSAFFDDVATVLAPLADPDTTVLLRSGAYLVHDDGFYRGISPLSRPEVAGEPFRSAMHAWTRVVSRPEPGLALLDAGKRDVPFDEGLPEPQLAADRLGAPTRPLTGEITAVNDQHAFLRLDPADPLRIGQVVRLGLSHPCTAFDKWRWIPVVAGGDEAEESDPVIVELVRTYF